MTYSTLTCTMSFTSLYAVYSKFITHSILRILRFLPYMYSTCTTPSSDRPHTCPLTATPPSSLAVVVNSSFSFDEWPEDTARCTTINILSILEDAPIYLSSLCSTRPTLRSTFSVRGFPYNQVLYAKATCTWKLARWCLPIPYHNRH